jgi:hypothetical protein
MYPREIFMKSVEVPVIPLRNNLLPKCLSVAMALLEGMSTSVKNLNASKTFLTDNCISGVRLCTHFLSAPMMSESAPEAENVSVCPICLTLPVEGRLLPLRMREMFLSQTKKLPS